MSKRYSKGKNSERGSSQYSRKVLDEKEYDPVISDKFLQERKITLVPRTPKQRQYMHMIDNCNLVIATGLAGTSKTYIPTMMAAMMLRAKQIDRIILIRTPTSDEESIGLLPGDVVEKTKYWLMPIIDTLNKQLTPTLVEYLIKREQILCFAPEFIKGMSFTNRDFVIFDEAEDMSRTIAISTVTRQGGGKMVLCGDLRQKVLNRESGLPLLLDTISKSPELQRKVGVIDFDDFEDIVRSEDCKLWVKAFVKHEIM